MFIRIHPWFQNTREGECSCRAANPDLIPVPLPASTETPSVLMHVHPWFQKTRLRDRESACGRGGGFAGGWWSQFVFRNIAAGGFVEPSPPLCYTVATCANRRRKVVDRQKGRKHNQNSAVSFRGSGADQYFPRRAAELSACRCGLFVSGVHAGSRGAAVADRDRGTHVQSRPSSKRPCCRPHDPACHFPTKQSSTTATLSSY